MILTPVEPRPLFRLASASPRRRLIFRLVGIPCLVAPAEVSEVRGETPVDTCLINAGLKAQASARAGDGDGPPWTLGADTIVVLDGLVLGKPAGEEEARGMLRRLSGRTHEVYTGWELLHGLDQAARGHAVTRVTFRGLDEDRVEDYVRAGEWTDKAGGYAIQGLGAFLITRIEGDPFNVMGLPVGQVVEAFLARGVIERYPL